MDSSCRFCLWSRPERSNDFAVLVSILPEGCLTNLPDSALYGLRRFNQSIQVRENCVISKSHIHKLLEIRLLQNALYGRLSRRRYSCPEGRPWGWCKTSVSQVATGVVLGEPGFA